MTEKKPFGGTNPDRHAPNCDDQLPLVSRVGRGIKGDGFRVEISNPDSEDETYLEGWIDDGATHTSEKAWTSENINGGRLSIQRIDRPFTNPSTFALTFDYRRPGREEWSVTTGGIPYLDTGESIASGMSNIFIRESVDAEYAQPHKHGGQIPPAPFPSSDLRWGQINWPHGSEPKDFNAPAPDEAWAATLTFGWGGDIPLPNLTDMADILGFARPSLEGVLNGVPGSILGSDDIKGYVDAGVSGTKQYVDDKVALEHVRLPLFVDPENKLTSEANMGWGNSHVRYGFLDVFYQPFGGGVWFIHLVANRSAASTLLEIPSSGQSGVVWKPASTILSSSSLLRASLKPGMWMPDWTSGDPSPINAYANRISQANRIATLPDVGLVSYAFALDTVLESVRGQEPGRNPLFAKIVTDGQDRSFLNAFLGLPLINNVVSYGIDQWMMGKGGLIQIPETDSPLVYVDHPVLEKIVYDSPESVELMTIPIPWSGQSVEYMATEAISSTTRPWQDSPFFSSIGDGIWNFSARAKAGNGYPSGEIMPGVRVAIA